MLHEHHIIVFDTETGGLSPGKIKGLKAPIMEFAAIVLSPTLEEVERVEFYLKPYFENPQYSSQALTTHNIPIQKTIDEGIEGKVAVKTLIDLFKKYSNGLRKKPLIGGHNLDFDNRFMRVLFELHKKEWDKLYEFTFDTLRWSHLKYGHKDSMINFRLPTCCAQEDIALIGAHRAMKDVEANTKLIIKYLKDLRSDSSTTDQDFNGRARDNFKFKI